MMMAVWTLIDSAELKAMAPTRTALVSATNGAAVLCFATAGAVHWPESLTGNGSGMTRWPSMSLTSFILVS